MHRILALAAFALTVFAAPGLTSIARADGGGTYTSWLCANRDTGQGVGASPEIAFAGRGIPLTVSQDCERAASGTSGVTMITGQPSHTDDGARAGLSWQAPAGITISSLRYWRALRSPGNAAHMVITENGTGPFDIYPADTQNKGETFYWFGTGANDGNLVDTGSLDQPFSTANGPIAGGLAPNRGAWYIAFGCDSAGNGGCDVSPGALNLRIFSAQMSLRDNAGPTVGGNVGGSLATDNPVRGMASVAFTASDAGAGVYRALLIVDGATVDATIPDANGGRCADVNPSNDNPYEFGSAAPCKGTVSGTFALDTSKVADGGHRVQVLVEDAGGNRASVLDRTITVDNQNNGIGPGDDLSLRGAANGQPAADQAILALSWSTKQLRTVRTAKYGRSQQLRGQLVTPDGQPIAGATIDVAKRLRSIGAKAIAAKAVSTDAAGRFTINFPRGPGYDVRASYRSHANDTIAVATNTASLRIRASVTLKVSPRTAQRKSRLRFSGRLRGGHIPSRGKQVALQVRAGKRWRTFQLTRTNKRGRFVTRYRLPGSQIARYRIRAISRYEASYPFNAGASRSLTIRKLL